MGNIRIEFSIGVFMLIGLACLFYLAVRLGDLEVFDDDHYALDARFVSSSGLKKGAFVEVGGVRVGKVGDISIDYESYESVQSCAWNSILELSYRKTPSHPYARKASLATNSSKSHPADPS